MWVGLGEGGGGSIASNLARRTLIMALSTVLRSGEALVQTAARQSLVGCLSVPCREPVEM